MPFSTRRSSTGGTPRGLFGNIGRRRSPAICGENSPDASARKSPRCPWTTFSSGRNGSSSRGMRSPKAGGRSARLKRANSPARSPVLPSAHDDGGAEAKLFDLLMSKLQIAIIKQCKTVSNYARNLREIAQSLEGKAAIPGGGRSLALIQEIQTDALSEDVTAAQLETVRKRFGDWYNSLNKLRNSRFTPISPTSAVRASRLICRLAEARKALKFREKVRAFLILARAAFATEATAWPCP